MNNSNPLKSSERSENLLEDKDKTKVEEKPNEYPEINFVLSHQDALAASPADIAVCGEEDPGEALELLVTKNAEE